MSTKAQPQFWPMISPLQAGKEHGMAVVADLVQIVGDNPVTIGDADRVWEATFNTEGRESGSTGFLIFNLRDLTHTNLDVVVSLNGQEVGHIRHYFP
jgi:hypothetical protein